MSEVRDMLRLSVAIENLLHHIEISDFKDSDGHSLLMNKHYLELRMLVK